MKKMGDMWYVPRIGAKVRGGGMGVAGHLERGEETEKEPAVPGTLKKEERGYHGPSKKKVQTRGKREVGGKKGRGHKRGSPDHVITTRDKAPSCPRPQTRPS